ncbi:phosphatidylinositol 4-kinase, related [Neospora caninum Liverpool]|uniref:Phosphatidylinositol 4-kinase, related n=1 Tax=Neospora caninum (strain Liverpool) TaxID=572307 RepID=F0V7L7_NEOCL|nr:phosphatidylinositol 4-kinase, related [Neospora caninum Liverpool]CBZ49708.1 phosphatidylinositol 4-kinase, related [Neospora caninum Liverpool]CEL64293.1 TPA: Phosphatidylinositol 4-kinase, related [Neospora caninum Liverpool]|eukprot:XP_003879743.1 phosphatidylinositol 4-kinase, related [Neospora caninum Liverpool]
MASLSSSTATERVILSSSSPFSPVLPPAASDEALFSPELSCSRQPASPASLPRASPEACAAKEFPGAPNSTLSGSSPLSGSPSSSSLSILDDDAAGVLEATAAFLVASPDSDAPRGDSSSSTSTPPPQCPCQEPLRPFHASAVRVEETSDSSSTGPPRPGPGVAGSASMSANSKMEGFEISGTSLAGGRDATEWKHVPTQTKEEQTARVLSSSSSSLGRRGDEGSLLRLFQSDYFDAYFHMYYLFHRQEPGVHEYLVNLLYVKRTDEDIIFYLPQLVQLSLVRFKTSSLHRFLLDKASKSMHLALMASWLYQSMVEDKVAGLEEPAQKMTQEVEMAVVNCKPLGAGTQQSGWGRKEEMEEQGHGDRGEERRRNSENEFAVDLFKRPAGFARGPLRRPTLSSGALRPRIPESLRHLTGPTTMSGAKVKLPSVYGKLGNPLALSTLQLLPFSSTGAVSRREAREKVRSGGRCEGAEEEASGAGDRNRDAPAGREATGPNGRSLEEAQGDREDEGGDGSADWESDGREMEEELQQFIMKQRRCDYFNTLNHFISLLIDVSNALALEPDRSLR